MNAAFAAFSEPFAWLVRGLVEYGWRDVTRSRIVPQGSFGGFDLSFLAGSQGRDGLVLLIPAVADGQRCHEDEAYSLEVQLTRNDQGQCFAIRSPDCNYFAEFPFDENNPLWCAGYIHQALTEYIPGFVRWRLGGGELTWGQRQGIPTVEAEPCTASLASWVGDQVRLHRTLDHGPSQGWWLSGAQPGAVVAGGAPTGPMIQMGMAAGVPDAIKPEGLRLLERPAQALSTMVWVHGMAAVCAVINIISIIVMFGGQRPFALVTNFILVVFISSMTWVARKGIAQYRTGQRGPLPWVAIVYAGLIPICFFGGIPVAIWAGRRWRDQRVIALQH